MSQSLSQLRDGLRSRYIIERELGRGAMATVYLARDVRHDRRVALKVLRTELSEVLGSERFLHEIRVTARLNHPHIIPVFDSGEVEGLLFYVMPFIDGLSLRTLLVRERQLGIAEALSLTRVVGAALAYAHAQNVVHRDLKPENILLHRGEPLIADFGLAMAVRDVGAERLTASGISVGTPAYMSPEQAAGDRTVGTASDLYALATLLYEMLAGDPPFTGSSVPNVMAKVMLQNPPRLGLLRKNVPPWVDEAVDRALAKVAADRFPTVESFVAALDSPDASSLASGRPPPLTVGGRVSGTRERPDAAPSRDIRTLASAVVASARDRLSLDAMRSRPRSRLVRTALMAMGVAAAGFLLVRPPASVRELLTPRADMYSGLPAWPTWSGVSGEHFSVVASVDSSLVAYADGADSLYVFDGRSWTGIGVPDSYTLRPFDGSPARRRLLATRSATDPDADQDEYWWLELDATGLRVAERLPGLGPDRPLSRWWSDGSETVVWTQGIERLEGSSWVREATATSGRIRSLWGPDFQHRFAVTTSAPDSLLVYDGPNWRMVDILPARSTRVPAYSLGVSLPDGTSVVLGEACDSTTCDPLIVQKEAFGESWRRVPIAAGLGIPIRRPALQPDCAAGEFMLSGAGGAGRDDYYVWGDWTRCVAESGGRLVYGCPPEWPCIWHVRQGRLEPVDDLRGRVVRAVRFIRGAPFVLLEDGTVWRFLTDHWRLVGQVPGLEHRRVAASRSVIVRATASSLSYEPGPGDTVSGYFVAPLQSAGALHDGIRAVAVRDSMIAVLAQDGSAYQSTCAITPGAGGMKPSLECATLTRLHGPAVAAIGLLPEGDVIGVGPGHVIRWRGGNAEMESTPAEAQGDTLWDVSVARDGTATVVGKRTLLQRDPRGSWVLLRRFSDGAGSGHHLAVLPNGDVAIGGAWLRLWERSADTSPLAVLHQPVLGDATIGALHALADGRLIAGFSNPHAPGVGGWIEVWAPHTQGLHSARVELPLTTNVTSLADDGSNLIIAGRGGTMFVPLTALPFHVAPDAE